MRFDGAVGAVVGGGAGLEELPVLLELGPDEDEDEGEDDAEVDGDVVLDGELGDGELDDDVEPELELLFDAEDDPPLEHAPASIPAAAISARPARPRERVRYRDPDRIRRLLRA